MYDVDLNEIIDYIHHRFKTGRTWTTTRVLDLSKQEQDSLIAKLQEEGIHSFIEDKVLMAWVN